MLERKPIYTLGKASEVIDKWLEESCDESESEVGVLDHSNSHLVVQSDIKTTDSVG